MVLYTMKLESNWMESRWMERILWNFKDRIRSNRKKNYQLQFSKVKKNSVDQWQSIGRIESPDLCSSFGE